MSKTQEALKLALEQAYLAGFNASADGYNGECGVGNASQCTQWLTERDNYIRKALAEQPAQEPVAWRAWFDADNGARWLFSLWPEEERLDVEWQPLYTSPPAQRKPLTDEQAHAMWSVAARDAALPRSKHILIIYKEAIEEAHGITGEQK